jgi:hypothetical protein
MLSTCFLLCALTGVDIKEIEKCVGNPTADMDNPILKAEQESQVNF